MSKSFVLLAGLLFYKPLSATEGGGSNYLPGFYGDFGMAVMPDAGTYFYNFLTAYRSRDGHTTTLLEMPSIEQITDFEVLGGRYFAGFFPAFYGIWDSSGPNNHGRMGVGDAYLMPGGLGWKFDKFSIAVFEGIVAPTGYYEIDGFNIGRNVWTFDHNLLFTASLPGGNEFNFTLGLMNNTENPATHYSSGDELHFDYFLGHYFDNGLGVGVGGSHYRQLNADRSPDGTANNPYSAASTIGLGVMYVPKIAERDVMFSLKWLHEFDVTGRLPNDYLILRTFVPF
ncbi:MAG: transporter [Methylomonas sp.]|nr:transporter [Methylomonas sp.]